MPRRAGPAAAASPSGSETRSRSRRALAAYVSSHGFGHAVRVAEVLAGFGERRPDVRIAVRATAPPWLFPPTFAVEARSTDVGMVQPNGVSIDFPATLAALEAFEATWSERVAEEAAWLAGIGAGVVVGDIPPLAFAAAARAGVPAIALGNFSWDWIYARYAEREPRFAPHARRAAAAYESARTALRLPFHAGMEAFRAIVDIPLAVRRAACSREEARRRLDLPREGPLVLLSFGGLGFANFAVDRLAAIRDVCFLTTEAFAKPPSNLLAVARPDLDYTMLLRACDAVLTKPGWGIVAASLVNGVRVLYTTRDDFPETPILVAALEAHATAEVVPLADLVRGEIRAPLERLLGRPVAETRLPSDGAMRAAERLAKELER